MPETSRCIRQGAAMAKQVVEACVNAGTCAAGASHYAALISALASIWSQVKHQLIATMNNDLIGGSVALAVASTLVGLAWRLWRWIRGVAHDRMFVSYEIPSGTPQYFAALRWVYDQPAVRRASRRLVVNPVGTPLANETDSHAPSSAPDDPEDPLELGLHTVPMLRRDQSLCARVGSSLVWVGHGGGTTGGDGVAAGGVDGPGLGAMGGGGARGSWYQQLLSGTRGHAGLAHASAFGWEGGVSGTSGGTSGIAGAGAVRLTVMGLDGEDTVRRILASGHRLGRGTARRFTRVYLPSAVVRSHGRGDGKHAWTRPEWVDAGAKPARPISSVILKGDDAMDVLADARAFLGLERWYAERGIPYRRGYLLHGPPGSGKTSLVCAVAGELRLPIYQLRLSGAGLDDEAFQRLLAATSRRAVVLLEDVDAARGAAVGSRTGEAMNRASPTSSGGVGGGRRESFDAAGGLTLPGLLNALDGVGAVDGRLLFMTCHRASSLEPALVRPGRIDVRVGFGPPDRAQAAALFRHFYRAPTRRTGTSSMGADGKMNRHGETRADDDSARSSPQKKRRPVAFGGAPPPTDPDSLDRLAERFADAAARSMWDLHPDGDDVVASMAALQGHLMMHREDPEGAIDSL